MYELFKSKKVDLDALPDAPEQWLWMTYNDAYSMPYEEVQALQLKALKKRFELLQPKIQILANFAEEQGVEEVKSLDDGALLLFPHSVYKSYPFSFIEKGQFDRLTLWLDNLTVDDLSTLDVSGVDTIDDWVMLLDEKTDVRVIHSTGTTGKLSFIPRNDRDALSSMRAWHLNFHGFGSEKYADEVEDLTHVPIIFNGYRQGALGQFRTLANMVKYIYDGDASMVWTRNPGRMSADVLSLGGRLASAAMKGEQGKVQISPKLAARREAHMAEQAQAAELGRQFLDKVIATLGGKRVMMMGNWIYQYGIAREGLDAGKRHVFARNSLIHTAGGLKGNKLPDNYREVVQEFLGVDQITESYGMSEITAMMPKCPAGKHHIQPWVIPYLLDPKTGEPRPKTGTQTGRFGFIDLAPKTLWGGFLSGDKITIDWDGKCACGRVGPRIHSDKISRYSEEEGGDDKITCAGAPDAHEKALAFIAEMV